MNALNWKSKDSVNVKSSPIINKNCRNIIINLAHVKNLVYSHDMKHEELFDD